MTDSLEFDDINTSANDPDQKDIAPPPNDFDLEMMLLDEVAATVLPHVIDNAQFEEGTPSDVARAALCEESFLIATAFLKARRKHQRILGMTHELKYNDDGSVQAESIIEMFERMGATIHKVSDEDDMDALLDDMENGGGEPEE